MTTTPAPSSPTIDLLDYICLPSVSKGLKLPDNTVYGRETHSVGGVFDFVTPPDANGNILVWRLKSASGGPGWDAKLVSPSTVSDALTEVSPVGPQNFKIHNGGKGFLLSQRFLPANQENFEINVLDPTQTNFDIYLNGKKSSSSNLGPVTQYVSGPYPINHGGNIGVQPTLVHHYFWGPNDMEENWWALHYGWLRWTAYHKTNGAFLQTQQSIHDTIAPAKVPKCNFPAGAVTVVNGALKVG